MPCSAALNSSEVLVCSGRVHVSSCGCYPGEKDRLKGNIANRLCKQIDQEYAYENGELVACYERAERCGQRVMQAGEYAGRHTGSVENVDPPCADTSKPHFTCAPPSGTVTGKSFDEPAAMCRVAL